MKNQLRLVVAGVLLGSAMSVVMAQNVKIAPITKPGKIKFPRATPAPTPVKGKFPRVTPTPFIKDIPPGPRMGERFNLRIWAVVLPGMPPRDWLGTLNLDDPLRWSISQSQAANYRRSAGETLEISDDASNRQGGAFTFSTFYSNHRKVKLKFDLSSLDNGQPVLRAAYRDTIDLLQQSGKTYKCTAGKGEVALYVAVERTGYIYGPRIQRPLPTATPRFHPPGGHHPQ
ncbi:hypothetical protein EON83_03115 [bacterium]|nr:MAG: hypothetical protein EON83_03115 [bacterium]